MNQEKRKSIGAIWMRQGHNGDWLSVSLELNGQKLAFVGFKNDYKKEPKHPDWKLFESYPKDNAPKDSYVPRPQPQSSGETFDDDSIPF